MKRIVIIAIHLGYWAMYLLLLTLMFLLITLSQEELRAHFTSEVFRWLKVMTPLAIIPGLVGFYGGYFILYPKFIARKKIGLFFLFVLITTVTGAIISIPTVSMFFPENNIELMGHDGLILMGALMAIMTIINLVIGTIIQGFITSYHDIQIKEELMRHNTAIELALVKSRINPHFLFNTLNNIDVLIQRNPDEASTYLNKLSEILRFMLYETKDEEIPFDVELGTIQRYIELQKLRTNVENYVTLQVDGDAANVKLQPMIFLPFIENAFKYAEHKKIPEAVKIKWKIEKDKIFFHCENTFSNNMELHHAGNEGGIGNELIRKRLSLLYPSKHELITGPKGEKFVVELIIART